MGKFFKVASDVVFAAGLIVAGVFLVGRFTGKIPFSAYIVSSGSMEPEIQTGSVVVVSPKSEYKIADVVTFYSGTDKKTTTTHRIVGMDERVIRTAGDSNNQPDSALVPRDKIIGEVRLTIPKAGYLAAFAKTPKGFILLVIVPATIIIYEELKSLWLELSKFRKKLGVNVGGSRLNKAFVVIPVIFGGLIFFSFSGSFFKDTETSSTNSFTAWISTPTLPPTITPSPTPAPGDLLVNELNVKDTLDKQWVELYNKSLNTINTNGWSISDNNGSDNLGSVDIPAGGYAVIVTTNYTGLPIPGGVPVIIVDDKIGGNGFEHNGDQFKLNYGTTKIDFMSYGNDHTMTPNTPGSPGNNQTLARHPNGTDTDTGGDWDAHASPTIGTANP